MKASFLAALLGAFALCVSSPLLAQNQGGNGRGVPAPEFDGQMLALGLALATGAVVAVKGRSRRPRQ